MSEVQWNKPTNLPTVGAHLRIKMKCGNILEGLRPEYIEKSTTDNPNYRDRCSNPINQEMIEGWAYQKWSSQNA